MKRILIIFSLSLAAVVFNACNSKEEQQAETNTPTADTNTIGLTKAQVANAEIKLGKVEQRQISGVVKANGAAARNARPS